LKTKYLNFISVSLILVGSVFLSACSDDLDDKNSDLDISSPVVDVEIAKVSDEVVSEDSNVKAFELDSFNSTVDGAFAPRFSVNEIKVNKGDLVKISVNTLSGTHNFTIDEFNVASETPEGEITVIEFTADQVGEFVFYCSKGQHRALGQWGTLIVSE